MLKVLYHAADRSVNIAALAQCCPSVVVLDLEESVARENLPKARAMLEDQCASLSSLNCLIAVRINGYDSYEFHNDLSALNALPHNVIGILPKPVTCDALSEFAVSSQRSIWCMGEEAAIAEQLGTLKAGHPRLDTVMIGVKDLAHDLGIPLDPNAQSLRHAANVIRAAAQTLGLQVIDGVAFGDEAQVRRAYHRGEDDGFDGVSFMRLQDVKLNSQAEPLDN
jgi:citrate lyase beta subunit